MSNCVPELYRKCLLFSVWSHDIVHMFICIHMFWVYWYSTWHCTSPEYWVCLPNSLEHCVTLSCCTDIISYMRPSKIHPCMCCEHNCGLRRVSISCVWVHYCMLWGWCGGCYHDNCSKWPTGHYYYHAIPRCTVVNSYCSYSHLPFRTVDTTVHVQ